MRALLKEFLPSIALAAGFAFLFQTTAFATFLHSLREHGADARGRRSDYDFEVRLRLEPILAAVRPPAAESAPSATHLRRAAQARRHRRLHPPQDGRAHDQAPRRPPGRPHRHREGRLWLNGALVPRRFERIYKYRESSGATSSRSPSIQNCCRAAAPTRSSSARTFESGPTWRRSTIPPGRYFMMGDNRDNSADSRFPEMGLVPDENLVGRAEAILYSWYSCERGAGCDMRARRRFATRLD